MTLAPIDLNTNKRTNIESLIDGFGVKREIGINEDTIILNVIVAMQILIKFL